MKYHEFKVRVPVLEGVKVRDWQEYIDHAIQTEAGHWTGDTGNPWDIIGRSGQLHRSKVTRLLPKPRTKLRYVPPVPGVDDLLTKEERDALLKDENGG